MALQADWFTSGSDRAGDYSDPFEHSQTPSPPLMNPISIDSTKAQVNERIQKLHHREERLFNMGISCQLKENSECSCATCPISEAGDADSQLGMLCKVGVEQERVLTVWFAKKIAADAVDPIPVAA